MNAAEIPVINVDPLACADGLIESAIQCTREQAALRVRFNIAANVIKRLVRELAAAISDSDKIAAELATAKRDLLAARLRLAEVSRELDVLIQKHEPNDDIPAFLRRQAD